MGVNEIPDVAGMSTPQTPGIWITHEGGNKYRVAEVNKSGFLCYYQSKDLGNWAGPGWNRGDSAVPRLVKGSVVQGTDEGDGWLRVVVTRSKAAAEREDANLQH